MNKRWYESKTMWLGLATMIAGAGPIVANFTGLVHPLVYASALALVGVANMYVRLKTNQGIE